MTLRKAVTAPLLIAALGFGCAQQPAGDVADTVYTNGKIYTVNEAKPWAEAVAIKDGKLQIRQTLVTVERNIL